ncbi:MAG: bifunctional glutamate N-acetyltransferase/amino-acid acetyltransferase ArgJ [Verrucomicrobia bacterium]|nr:MAG: bifunctional glutamate N-acetyltransferase/amino-acid acetyltransferase ArgJ [Verrucomicrobiota bacterium]
MSKPKIVVQEKIQLPSGFRAAGEAVGLKRSGRRDMALLVSDQPAAVAGVFTTNQVQSATVKLNRTRLRGGIARAVIVNSGNANACTGPQGMTDADRMTELTGLLLEAPKSQVFVCSTGRIGIPMPMKVIEAGIAKVASELSARGGKDAATAIMTTDTTIKHATVAIKVNGKPVTLCGMAKGSGMIEPKMATMLAFLLTDAAVERKSLQAALKAAADESFNRISVDGDRSTNDTTLLLANGAAGNKPLKPGHPDWATFCAALNALTLNLAIKMARDGEGATKLVTVRVCGAKSDADADLAARAVANSLLVKTSWVGTYPNWGRIMDSIGYSRAKVVEEQVGICYNKLLAVKHGVFAGASTYEQLAKIQEQKEFTITVNLNLGRGAAVIYTCDCTEEYVQINYVE